MADRVLDTIDRKKQVLTAVESGLKTATETVVPFVKEDIIDPLANTFWGRVASGAADRLLRPGRRDDSRPSGRVRRPLGGRCVPRTGDGQR